MYVFFFKQKTAYEMRISDWSSDVCSSDLLQEHRLNRFEHDAGDAIGIGREVGQVHDAGNGKSRASRTNCLNQLLSLGQGETTYPVDLLRDHYFAGLKLGNHAQKPGAVGRSAERRVGQECVSTCSVGWSPCT